MATAQEQEDLLFARYRKCGDPDLLAQVFDRTAPRLLRLAIHLSRDPAQAEDLVQATFVTAIEKAQTFELGRPVLPWLTGILEHHAREARSRARRSIVPQRLQERPVPTPPEHAESRELDEAVARGLDSLPETYRTVMVLKLRHGLKPAQIADALGRSPGAVRVQIHRGTELLRNYLPVGLALSSAFGLMPTLGLAAMRSEIRRHAATHASLALQSIGIGGILMKKTTTAVLGVLLLTGTALYMATDSAPAPLVDGEGVPGRDMSTALADNLVADADLTAEHVPTAPPTRRALPPVTPTAGGAIVIRTLWADDRSPAPGIGLTVRPHDGRHPDLHTDRRVSGREGSALFDDLEPGDYGVYIDRKAKRPTKNLSYVDETEELRQDYEQLFIEAQDRFVVAQDLTQRLEVTEFQETQVHDVQSWTLARADASRVAYTETFLNAVEEFSEQMAPDQHSLEDLRALLNDLRASSRLPDEEPIAVETVGDEAVYVDVLIERGLVAEGRVFDPDGNPVADAEIWLRGKSREDAHLVTRSDDEGRFQLAGMESDSRVSARAPGFLVSAEVRIRRNQDLNGLELRFTERAVSLRAMVVDQAGEPVPGASVRIGDPGSEPKPIQLRSDAQGGIATDGVPPGQIPVLVLASGYQPYRELLDLRIEVDEETERRFALDPGWTAEGHLRDFEGNGQEGTTIYADAEGKPTTEVTTGPAGAFRLECLPPGPVSLRIEEGEHRALIVPVQGSSGDVQTHDLVLRPWGQISGRIVDDLGQPLAKWQVRAMPNDAKPRSARSDEAGGFAIDTEPELGYHLEVQPPRGETYISFARSGNSGGWQESPSVVAHFLYEVDSSSGPPSMRTPGWKTIPVTWLGEISGVREDVEIVIPSHLVPSATVRGRIADAGGNPLKGSIRVHVDGGSRRVRLDDQGAFEVGPLIPGDYAFQVVSTGQAFPSFYLDVDVLAPHQELDVGTVLPPLGGSLQVSVLDGRAEQGRLSGRVLDSRGRTLATLGNLNAVGQSVPMTPGEYTIEVLDGQDVVSRRGARVNARETTRLSIPVK